MFFLGRPVTIGITTDRDRYFLGESVTATITLEARKRCKIREGIVELVCLGYYAFGNKNDAPRAAHVRVTQPLISQSELSSGERRAIDVKLDIPADAPPSFGGTNIFIQWRLRARLEGPGFKTLMDHFFLMRFVPLKRHLLSSESRWEYEEAVGLGKSVVLHVARSAGAQPVMPFLPYEDTSTCEILIDVPAEGAAGEPLHGRISVHSERTVQVKSITVELNRVEKLFYKISASNFRKTLATVPLEGGHTLSASDTVDYSFEIMVPENACAGVATEHAQAFTELRAVVEPKGHKHCVRAVPLLVYTTAD